MNMGTCGAVSGVPRGSRIFFRLSLVRRSKIMLLMASSRKSISNSNIRECESIANRSWPNAACGCSDRSS
jgi:phosphoenolpyruvate-protein kinase (PTS system EI component)